MCGIWALINLVKTQPNIEKYLSDFWAIQNRGPDNSCFETYPQAWVGFHRLAIMDTSFSSNQPYILQERTRTIVFICNGEIYNFRELIEKYELDIVNNSDCLVIPKLYLKLSCTDWYSLFDREIKGEFAFVLLEFDHLKNLRHVFAGRDQIGIRPLYYHRPDDNSEQLLFCSEIKGAKNYNNVMTEFPPGNILKIKIDEFNRIEPTCYDFNWVYNVKQLVLREEEYLSNVRNTIIEAVRRRLEADRPIAFLLSGGVDSSLVASISSRILGTNIKTFCCGMEGATDFEYARKVAEHIGSDHTEVYFTEEEGLEAIRDVIYAIESWDTTTVRASVGQYMVSKHIGTKTDYKVVLVGEGPDEVCSSYLFNWNAPDSESLDLAAKEYVRKIHYFDSKRGDRCISYWGLEGRVPLLDPLVIEAYWQIPSNKRNPKYKGIEKWWLREAFNGMDLLPDEILWRKKEAFSDGVSSKTRSWYEIIQEYCENEIKDEDMVYDTEAFTYHPPLTKESYFFRKVFVEHFGENRHEIIPNFWLPKWDNEGKEITGYIDPSARILDVYD